MYIIISTYTVVVVLMTQVGRSSTPAGNQVFIVIAQFVHARAVNVTTTTDAYNRIVAGGHGYGRRSGRSMVYARRLVGHRGHGNVTAAVEHGVLKHRWVDGHMAVLAIGVGQVRFHRVLLLELLLVLVLRLMLVVLLLVLLVLLVLLRVPFGTRVRREHFHQFVPLSLQLLDLRL